MQPTNFWDHDFPILLLGWLLALLSPTVVNAITKRYSRKEVKKALLTELSGVSGLLVALVYQIEKNLGRLNRETLKWTLERFKKYQDLSTQSELLNPLEKLLNLPDEQLIAASKLMPRNPSITLGLKEIQTPFLDAHLIALPLFKETFQSRILEIKSKIGIINQEIIQARFYFEKSFDSTVNDNNRKILDSNTLSSYNNLSQQAKIAISQMENLENL